MSHLFEVVARKAYDAFKRCSLLGRIFCFCIIVPVISFATFLLYMLFFVESHSQRVEIFCRITGIDCQSSQNSTAPELRKAAELIKDSVNSNPPEGILPGKKHIVTGRIVFYSGGIEEHRIFAKSVLITGFFKDSDKLVFQTMADQDGHWSATIDISEFEAKILTIKVSESTGRFMQITKNFYTVNSNMEIELNYIRLHYADTKEYGELYEANIIQNEMKDYYDCIAHNLGSGPRQYKRCWEKDTAGWEHAKNKSINAKKLYLSSIDTLKKKAGGQKNSSSSALVDALNSLATLNIQIGMPCDALETYENLISISISAPAHLRTRIHDHEVYYSDALSECARSEKDYKKTVSLCAEHSERFMAILNSRSMRSKSESRPNLLKILRNQIDCFHYEAGTSNISGVFTYFKKRNIFDRLREFILISKRHITLKKTTSHPTKEEAMMLDFERISGILGRAPQ